MAGVGLTKDEEIQVLVLRKGLVEFLPEGVQGLGFRVKGLRFREAIGNPTWPKP